MDTVLLSRLQFAATAAFHFIFVPLTLGLSILVAYMETKYVRTGDKDYLRMAKFWGRLFVINFALGVVTGITMEFQFGMNWAEYSRYVGDIFGSPLAIEATVAFFLESTFLGVWIFGWNKISPKLHALSIWLVALATNLSALWILIANGWMQHPVGYVINNNRAEMVDFWAVVTNAYGLLKFAHTVLSGWVVAGFFVLGISAYHLLNKNETEFFKKCLKIGAIFALVSSILVAAVGDFHAKEVAHTQPTKLAAMESLWNTTTNAPMYLLLIPDPENEKNSVEAIGIPSMLSILAGKKEIKGLKEFSPSERPPVTLTFVSFRLMVGLGFLFILLTLLVLIKFRYIENSTIFLKLLLWSIPLPYIAGQLGWIVAEVGRQPWIVYGLLKTTDAVSKAVEPSQVLASLIGFTVFYGALGIIDIYLLAKYARKGPEPKEV
ncbi:MULTISPECIES: cytochrome ubiquinol oxidase subunit I [Thermodesulfovibrio]|jgi:cytochrome d ubiquinol oxidase subunit I|uniref:Cytochrome D ubiquinol oxidase subunit I n=2 Tax=Thermodesulfovibrio yellowstonii TaxID=28262 RepID=B5YFR9_THEYD|nr:MULTISPECIES: cytochrome ubiquinol oxidase subunit I [Thermodesulfovibrio]ACI21129.1 cytochrome D ubiquinol oxidase subunit I [Thermodesulfovibrio yellowstonii DSM 11347]GLI53292.1 cytochrome ubiquinol oxidase subunit I [Thermodesulfovibrio islandicus]